MKPLPIELQNLEAAKRHMESCRVLIGAKEDEVLYEAIERVVAELLNQRDGFRDRWEKSVQREQEREKGALWHPSNDSGCAISMRKACFVEWKDACEFLFRANIETHERNRKLLEAAKASVSDGPGWKSDGERQLKETIKDYES